MTRNMLFIVTWAAFVASVYFLYPPLAIVAVAAATEAGK